MSREFLPNRRASKSFDFEHEGIRYTGTISQYADGRLAEMFLRTRKPGSGLETSARDIAVAASLALQHGAAADTLCRALTRSPDGACAGPLGRLLELIEEGKR